MVWSAKQASMVEHTVSIRNVASLVRDGMCTEICSLSHPSLLRLVCDKPTRDGCFHETPFLISWHGAAFDILAQASFEQKHGISTVQFKKTIGSNNH